MKIEVNREQNSIEDSDCISGITDVAFNALRRRQTKLTQENVILDQRLLLSEERVSALSEMAKELQATSTRLEQERNELTQRCRESEQRRQELKKSLKQCKKGYDHARKTVWAMEKSKTWRIGRVIATGFGLRRSAKK